MNFLKKLFNCFGSPKTSGADAKGVSEKNQSEGDKVCPNCGTRLFGAIVSSCYKCHHAIDVSLTTYNAGEDKLWKKATEIYQICNEGRDEGSVGYLINLLHDSSLDEITRFAFMAFISDLGDVGFDNAEIAAARVIRDAPGLSEADRHAVANLNFTINRKEAKGFSAKSHEEAVRLWSEPILEHLKERMSCGKYHKIIVTGGDANWLFEIPEKTLRSCLGGDYNISVLHTRCEQIGLILSAYIKEQVVANPTKKQIFIAPLPSYPGFPFGVSGQNSLDFFPVLDEPYNSRFICYGMLRWDFVLDAYQAASCLSNPNSSVEIFTSLQSDPSIFTSEYKALKSTTEPNEERRLLIEMSKDRLSGVAKGEGLRDVRYVGTMNDLFSRRLASVAIVLGKIDEAIEHLSHAKDYSSGYMAHAVCLAWLNRKKGLEKCLHALRIQLKKSGVVSDDEIKEVAKLLPKIIK